MSSCKDSWSRRCDKIAHHDARRKLLSDEEIAAVHRALVDAVLHTDPDDLSPLAKETLWTQHVALAEEGLASTDAAAGSANSLAHLLAERYEYESAIELASRAIEWGIAGADYADISNRPRHPPQPCLLAR